MDDNAEQEALFPRRPENWRVWMLRRLPVNGAKLGQADKALSLYRIGWRRSMTRASFRRPRDDSGCFRPSADISGTLMSGATQRANHDLPGRVPFNCSSSIGRTDLPGRARDLLSMTLGRALKNSYSISGHALASRMLIPRVGLGLRCGK